MVVIRLSRFGKKHTPRYRVTVADQRRYPTAKYLEILGHFNPHPSGKEKGLTLDMERVNHWIKCGAQPTPRVKSLLKKMQAN